MANALVDYKDKTTLIIGGATGMGAATGQMVAEQGADDSSSLASQHQLVVTKNKTRDRRKTVIPRTLV